MASQVEAEPQFQAISAEPEVSEEVSNIRKRMSQQKEFYESTYKELKKKERNALKKYAKANGVKGDKVETAWIKSVRKYQVDGGLPNFLIPRKGSAEHAAVSKIYERDFPEAYAKAQAVKERKKKSGK